MGHYDWCAVHSGEHTRIPGVCRPERAGAPTHDVQFDATPTRQGPFTRPTQPANPGVAEFRARVEDRGAELWAEIVKDLKPGYAKDCDRMGKTALGHDEKDLMAQELFDTATALVKAAMPGITQYAVFSHARKLLLRAAGLEDEL